MADDPDPGLRKLLEDELADLAPKIRGSGDVVLDQPQPSGLEVSSISPDGVTALFAQLTRLLNRRSLIRDLLDGMDRVRNLLDALRADGWPNPVDPATVTDAVLQELLREQADVEAAIKMFREAAININTGAASFTSQEAPTEPGP